MTTLHLTAHVNEKGELTAKLPVDVPPVEVPDESVTWTDEELEELLKPVPPKTGKEIVESGLLGGWEDADIVDGATWVEEQRRKHTRKFDW
ncbi:MAG: hypothetical protein IT324_27580 [Anaerolineae bacterium]|nr:hypothetical protein [Anaerolineae bacterium]